MIDFSMPTQKWDVKWYPYQNQTERELIRWAFQVQKEEISDVFMVKSFLDEKLKERMQSHKSRRVTCQFTKIEVSEDCKSVIVKVPRVTLNSDKEIVEEYYKNLLIIKKHESQAD